MSKPSTFEELTRALESKTRIPEGEKDKGTYSIEQMGEMIPGIVMLQDYYSQTLTYINERGRQYLGRTLEELRQMGKAYFDTYLHPEDVEENLPRLIDLLNRNEYKKLISFFLRVRRSEQHEWEWFFHTAKLFGDPQNGTAAREIILTATAVRNLSDNGSRLARLLDENEFKKKYSEKFNSLTKREKEIIQLVAAGNNSRKIAELLFISEATVETHRKNIRRKINAGSNYDMVLFAQSFDLI